MCSQKIEIIRNFLLSGGVVFFKFKPRETKFLHMLVFMFMTYTKGAAN